MIGVTEAGGIILSKDLVAPALVETIPTHVARNTLVRLPAMGRENQQSISLQEIPEEGKEKTPAPRVQVRQERADPDEIERIRSERNPGGIRIGIDRDGSEL
jgi:hypothetical protein